MVMGNRTERLVDLMYKAWGLTRKLGNLANLLYQFKTLALWGIHLKDHSVFMLRQ